MDVINNLVEFNKAVELCRGALMNPDNRSEGGESLKVIMVYARQQIIEEIPMHERVDIMYKIFDLIAIHDEYNLGTNKIDKLFSVLNMASPIFSNFTNPVHAAGCLTAIRNADRKGDDYFDLLLRLVGSFYLSLQRKVVRDENRERALDRMYSKLADSLKNLDKNKKQS